VLSASFGWKKNDLLTMLLEARDGDSSSDQRLAGMSDKQLRDEAMTLFLARYETTAIALSWTWYLLSQHPEVEAKLLTELNSVLGGRSPTVADITQLSLKIEPGFIPVPWPSITLRPKNGMQ